MRKLPEEVRKANKREADRRYYQQNREKILEKVAKWELENKEHVDNYRKEYRKRNSKQIIERVVEWKKLHPEAVADNSRQRRAKKKNNGFEKYSTQDVLSTYGIVCYVCNVEIDLTAPRNCRGQNWELGLHIDHVIAIANGGPDTLDNVRPAHAKCNIDKGTS